MSLTNRPKRNGTGGVRKDVKKGQVQDKSFEYHKLFKIHAL